MWIIENHTPFQAERSFLRDIDGAEVWIVVVHGTFQILPDGTTEIAETQEPVSIQPEFYGEPGVSSLKYESDFILNKPGTDILLHGHAYAPNGHMVEKSDVILSVGSIQKRLLISGDRYWEKGLFGLSKTPIEPFDRIPLVYERAFGGSDESSENPEKYKTELRNPAGTGFPRHSKHLTGKRVPNIWYPKSPNSNIRQSKTPAGFGPIPSNWEPRKLYAGTYDEHWQKNRKPLLPDDFNPLFNQCAPADQQFPYYLEGGERVFLKNLTKSGKLSFSLPEIQLRFQTLFKKSVEEHKANLHTVILEPDLERVRITWHTALRCHNREHLLQGTIVTLES